MAHRPCLPRGRPGPCPSGTEVEHGDGKEGSMRSRSMCCGGWRGMELEHVRKRVSESQSQGKSGLGKESTCRKAE